MVQSSGDLCLLSIVEIKKRHCVRNGNLQSAPICSIKKVWIHETKLWKDENQQKVVE